MGGAEVIPFGRVSPPRLGGWTRTSFATRKEQKTLEKEIRFHLIPEEQRASYADALVIEWDTWRKYGAVAALDHAASQAVEERYDRAHPQHQGVLSQ